MSASRGDSEQWAMANPSIRLEDASPLKPVTHPQTTGEQTQQAFAIEHLSLGDWPLPTDDV